MRSDPGQQVKQSYPLSMLFVLVTICAIVLAMVSPLARKRAAFETTLFEVGITTVIGVVSVAGIGIVIGFFHRRRLRGVLQGMAVGAVLGAIIVPTIYIPPSELRFMVSAALTGCVLIVAIAASMRWHSSELPSINPPEEIVVAEVVPVRKHPLDPD